MKKLLSVPENLVPVIHELEDLDPNEWLARSDPPGGKVGSGGGTAWLLAQDWEASGQDFSTYLSGEKRVVVHAGGQSRRLPGYAPSGKILTPIPVFRWSRGQRLDQNLLDLQLPLCERLLELAGPEQNTLVASGDVLTLVDRPPVNLPRVDVLCMGIWVEAQRATKHGVFFTSREEPGRLQFMLQKPSLATIEGLSGTHLYQMDVGLWILSDRAVNILMAKSGWDGRAFRGGLPQAYDLYGSFGPALGSHPAEFDESVSGLSVAIVPLEGGEFFHFGTSLELITSMDRIQNRVHDLRTIWHARVKPQPTLFTQNAVTDLRWEPRHHHIWIENSHIPGWALSDHHVLTGIPQNQWNLSLPPGLCLDVVPLVGGNLCVRPYGIGDSFSGSPADPGTLWMGRPLQDWLGLRGLDLLTSGLFEVDDLQRAPLFPVLAPAELSEEWILGMTNESVVPPGFGERWVASQRLSAEAISREADLAALYRQRDRFRLETLPLLARNHLRSVFFQLDLRALARDFARGNLALPPEVPVEIPVVTRIRDAMFRAEVLHHSGGGSEYARRAFTELQEAIIGSLPLEATPRLAVQPDQIVWGRSPARLDLAGGWSDTPPYCIQTGGKVVNVAVNLNGQPPLQVFLRRSDEPILTLRSIDNGVSEVVSEYAQLQLGGVGSAFSIPRAALVLAGFHPQFGRSGAPTLRQQLQEFGGGIEISLFSAIPKGSGLGTSSILAATILGALSDFCRLGWSKEDVCRRTLVLEQLLTSGGGWQDQYGGALSGLKLLETDPGWQERVAVRWLPNDLFTAPGPRDHWLLYYTGMTRVAQTILGEIVAGMFLNEGSRLSILDEIRAHAVNTADAFQRCDLEEAGRMVAHSWKLNKALDSGTSTPEVDDLIVRIRDWTLGLKLLGAGGGGYLLICAKDSEAAQRIRNELTLHRPNDRARFVRMDVSHEGFQLSRS